MDDIRKKKIDREEERERGVSLCVCVLRRRLTFKRKINRFHVWFFL